MKGAGMHEMNDGQDRDDWTEEGPFFAPGCPLAGCPVPMPHGHGTD